MSTPGTKWKFNWSQFHLFPAHEKKKKIFFDATKEVEYYTVILF